MLNFVYESLIAVGILALLTLSGFIGGWIARRVKVHGDALPQVGVLQGAMLGLLALMLGFSYSGAMNRLAGRQELIVAEANAVGTAWLRADLLPDPHRARLKDALRRYTAVRVELFDSLSDQQAAPLVARLNSIHAEAWAAGVEAVGVRHDLVMAITPPLNEIADLLAARNAATSRHLPTLIVAVLLACACASVASIGYSQVFNDRRTRLPAAVLVLLIGASLWITIDLDYPRLGLIRMDGTPLTDLRQSLAIDGPGLPVPPSP